MLLTHWLGLHRAPHALPRRSWRAVRQLKRNPPRQAVEQLESRLVLSSVSSSYATASSEWFGTQDITLSPSNELTGSSTFSGPLPVGVIAHQYLVRLTPEATAQARSLAGVQSLISSSSVDLQVSAGLGLPGQVLVATSDWDSVRVVQTLEANPAVAYFEETFFVGATALPNESIDSLQFSQQYALNNTGQTGGIADADIDAPEAWDITTGSATTVIAQIDSGVDYTHPDLYLNIWLNQGEIPEALRSSLTDVDTDGLITFRDLNDPSNASFVTDLNGSGYIDAEDLLDDPHWADGIDTDGNGFEDDLVGWDFVGNDNRPFDEHRHGTHVAGIMGATGNNADTGSGFDGGIAGVNWQTSIMPLRFLDAENKGDIADAIEAINYTTLMRTRDENAVNVRVSNNSWGSSNALSQALSDAVSGNQAADILFVAAAGNGDVLGQGINNDQTPFYPASLDLPNVISVAALNDRGQLASFSNFGASSVDIAAPGVDIVSLEPGGGYITRSGTSMATPYVSGVAALVFDAFPGATALEVRDAIFAGADTRSNLMNSVSAGRSLNAFGALNASTFAPVPELVPIPDVTTAGTTEIDVTVTFSDPDGGSVDTSTFDIRDVEITREGFSQTLLRPVDATLTMANGHDAASYRFAAPGGTWDATDNGTWFVSLREGEVRDSSGLYSAPRLLGEFTVAIGDPNVYFVNTTLDTVDADLTDGIPADSAGHVSLRAAIMQASTDQTTPRTIVIPDGIYTLTIPREFIFLRTPGESGDLGLANEAGVTLIGGGAQVTKIDAQGIDRVLQVGGIAELRGLSLQNGNAEIGGGILNTGTLTLESVMVADNTATESGGGVFSTGSLTIQNSSIENNRTTSRFFGRGGGGIALFGALGGSHGEARITHSSIVSNTSSDAGGGIASFDANLVLDGVTIDGNTAQRGDGGGLLLQSDDDQKSHTLTNVTVTQNTALNGSGGGLMVSETTTQVSIANSVIAENQARTSDDVEGHITSAGDNLFGQPSETDSLWRSLADNTADFDQIGTAQSSLSPELTPLQQSTGIIQVRVPLADGRSSNSNIAGIAKQALQPGTPIVYSTAELEPNNSRGQAMRLDDRGWSLDANPEIANSTTVPHVTITGTGDGTFDYYSFTVSEPNTTAVFDIDNGSVAAGEEFDTELFLFDSSDNLLALNDDGFIEPGSTSAFDARIEYTFPNPGYYTIAVGAFNSSYDGAGRLTGSTPPVGKRYILNVSIDHHVLSPTTFNPTSAADFLFPIAGTATSTDYLFSATEGRPPFQIAQNFAAGDSPVSVVLGDVNGDGIDDIVTTNARSDNVSVLRGNGDGTFQPVQTFSAGNGPDSLVLGDVNGDGIDDIVTANAYSDNVSVLRGNGDGTFQSVQNFSAGNGPYSLVLGDVNGDGLTDIITANRFSDNVSVLRGNGDATFQRAQDFAAGNEPVSVVLGDVNGDGIGDIVTANVDGDNLSVLTSNGDGTFESAQSFPAGDGPYAVILGDVDGDGFDDIVTANRFSDNVSVLRGNGDATFQAAQHFATGNGPVSVILEDLNGDGIDDIVTANRNSYDVSVLHGNGDSTFQAAQNFEAGATPVAVVLGDVNGDGIGDIVTANRNSDSVNVLRGNENGTFQSGRTFAAGDSPNSVVLGDVNGDGIDDIVAANTDSDYVSVLRGNGDGTFQSKQAFVAGDSPISVVLGDVNGDGIDDIVTANADSDNVSVLRGNGDGTFELPQNCAAGDSPNSVVLGDVNGDGSDDIITANRDSNNVSVLHGNGDGTFQTAQNYATGDSPYSVVLGDVNGDGIDDIVTANFDSNAVSVLHGNGDGTFQAAQNFPVGVAPVSAVLGDVDGDGSDDIVTANRVGNVSVLRGNGDGTFQSALSFVADGGTSSVALGDVNGDGIDDIVTANRFADNVSVLRGNGDGTFQTVQSLATGNGPVSVVLGDVNGDGVDDIVTANRFSDSVNVQRSAGVSLVGLTITTARLDSLPVRESPLLFASDADVTYWLSSAATGTGSRIGRFTLWSYSRLGGVRRLGSFVDSFNAGRAVHLVATQSTLVIELERASRVFDIGTGEIVSRDFEDGTFKVEKNFATEFGPYPIAVGPYSVVLGDVNGDGIDDIVTANGYSDMVSVLRGKGDGTFQAAQKFNVGDYPESVVLGDMNGDGFGDIITANHGSDDVSILRNKGDGTFEAAQTFPAGDGPHSLVLGDVNGDGFDDIVTANGNSDNVSVLLGNGDGTFQTVLNFSVGDAPRSVVVSDFNGDGFADLVTANGNSDNVSVLHGNGDGTFQGAQSSAAGDDPVSVVVGDVNRDGFDDIVTANYRSNNVSVLRGNGDGSFQVAQSFAAGDGGCKSVVLGDVNGDGIDDIVTANYSSNNVSVLRGNGDGSFQVAQSFVATLYPISAVLSDVNGDGLDDIVTANRFSDNVSVLLGTPSFFELLDVSGTTVLGNREGLQVQQNASSQLQPLLVEQVKSAIGPLQRLRDYEFVQLAVFEDKLLATVRLTDTTDRPGELQLLLIDAPQFDQSGKVLPSAVENLTLSSDLRLTDGGTRQLFVNGENIYMVDEIVGSGVGAELLVFDRTKGLRLVADQLLGPDSSQISDFAAVGADVYFTALMSHVDNDAQQTVLQRRLYVVNQKNEVRVVRAGQEATRSPSQVGSTVFFISQLEPDSPDLLWSYDTSQEGVPAIGVATAESGSASGFVFLDRNGDRRRDSNEPGRSGVTLYVDLNGNGRREDSEPFVVSGSDDPATTNNETGGYVFTGLPAGNYQIREVTTDGFVPTSPITILSDQPDISRLASAVTGAAPAFGLPSVVGDDIVYVDQSTDELVREHADGTREVLLNLQSMIPDDATPIQSIGTSHAQNGDSVVFTVTLTDGRELVLTADSSGHLDVFADAAIDLNTRDSRGEPQSISVVDVEDNRNRGFDSLSIADGVVGFLGETSAGDRNYYLGDGLYYAEFAHSQVVLDGDNEVFVDRVVEDTGDIITGSDLFLDKATLDAQVGGNTGWQIATRLSATILPLTFFDRVFDASVSGTDAVFHASNTDGTEAVYLAEGGQGTTRLADMSMSIPGGTGTFTGFGSLAGGGDAPSVALDGPNVVLIGQGQGGQIGLYAVIDGTLRTIVDTHSDFGGKTLTDLAIGHQAISGNRIVFRAVFDDGTESIDLADLLAEPVATVTVLAGETVSDVDFGASAQPGTILGISFTDANVDGVFGSGETVNAGRTIFLDANGNGIADDSELSTITDANGQFVFNDLPAETTYVVREELPSGIAATSPRTLSEATVLLGAAGTVDLALGSVDAAALGETADGEVSGVVFDDVNGNGSQDTGESAIAGVTVFVDENGDGVLNGGERSAQTGSDGTYLIDQLRGVPQTVRLANSNAALRQTNAPGNVFTTAQKLRTTDTPGDVAVLDLNGDGSLDVATTLTNVGVMRLFFNDGTGVFPETGTDVALQLPPGAEITQGGLDFVTPVRLGGEDIPSAMVVGYLNRPTMAVVTLQGGSQLTADFVIAPQDFEAGGIFESFDPGTFRLTDVATGDFNGDGFDDLAVAVDLSPATEGLVAVFDGTADGSFVFRQTVQLPAGSGNPTAIAAGPLVGGGAIQLAVGATLAGTADGVVTVLQNTSTLAASSFSAQSALSTSGKGTSSVAVADLDGDGFSEIVGTNFLSNAAFIIDQPMGTFSAARLLPTGSGPESAELSDIDLDGDLDIVFTQVGSARSGSVDRTRFGILRNDGDTDGDGRAEFQPADTSGVALLPDGTIANSLAIGQLNDDNGDGVTDAADIPDVLVTIRSDPSFLRTDVAAGANTVNVRRNSVGPGALRVNLYADQRTATGLDFGLQTVNQLPEISAPADQMIVEDGSTGPLPVTVSDAETPVDSLIVSVTSSNTLLVPNNSIAVGGSGASRTVEVTPAPNLSGSTTITLTVSDGTDTQTSSFLVSVSPVDDPAPSGMDESYSVYAGESVELAVLDNEDAANEDVGEPIVLTAASSSAGGQVTISSDFRRIVYTPASGFSGSETIDYSYRAGTNPQTASPGSATATITVNAVDLVVAASDDDITISQVDGQLDVERNGTSDAAYNGIPAAAVRSIVVTAGAADNVLDLSGVRGTTFTFGTVAVTIDGGDGNDRILGSAFADIINCGAGNDSVFADAGDDTIHGNDGDDSLLGNSGDDLMFGDAGADMLFGGAGKDRLDGGADDDMVFGQGGAGDTVTGGAGNDTLDGGSGGDFLLEATEHDEGIRFFFGTDQLIQQTSGGVVLEADTLNALERARLTGGRGDDLIDMTNAPASGMTEITVNGAVGDDTIIGSDRAEQLLGGGGDDSITSHGGFDRLLGGSGRDRLIGGDGNNKLLGSRGDDTITGGLGNDTIDGGTETDWLVESGDVSFVLTPDSLTGLGTDRLKRIENASLTGGASGNLLDASAFNTGRVLLFGLGGADSILGSPGDDRLEGGNGSDTIFGLLGNDTINGGDDADLLIGGPGDDNLAGALDSVTGDSDTDTLVGGTGDGTVDAGDTFDDLTERIDDFFIGNPLPVWADGI
ncbi:S8 family serine peptidase [bacterium]|nr:S8 family serine peptidase [bacterium]